MSLLLCFLGSLGFRFCFLFGKLGLVLGFFFLEAEPLLLALVLQLRDTVFFRDAVAFELLGCSLLFRRDIDFAARHR